MINYILAYFRLYQFAIEQIRRNKYGFKYFLCVVIIFTLKNQHRMFIAKKGLQRNAMSMLYFRNIQGIKLEKFKYELPETLINQNDYYKCIRDKTKILNYVPDYTLKKIYSHLTTQQTHWESIKWVQKQWLYEGALEKEFYIYSTDVEDYKIYLRLNDFPEQPLYTIVYDDIELFHVNKFGRRWTSDHSSNKKQQGRVKNFEE